MSGTVIWPQWLSSHCSAARLLLEARRLPSVHQDVLSSSSRPMPSGGLLIPVKKMWRTAYDIWWYPFQTVGAGYGRSMLFRGQSWH
jgi:hypothetical protein